jgi:hypothetical protein
MVVQSFKVFSSLKNEQSWFTALAKVIKAKNTNKAAVAIDAYV